MNIFIKIIFGIILFSYILWFIIENFIDNKKKRDYINERLTIIVINLDRSEDRMNKLKKDLISYGFKNIVRMRAIDGKGLKSKKELEDYDGLPCLGEHDLNDDNQITKTACYLSHLKVLKYAMSSSSEWTLILEDDMIFKKNPIATIGILYDIIKKTEYNMSWLCPSTTECLLVNKKSSKKLYNILNQKSEFVKEYNKNYNEVCVYDWALLKAIKKYMYNDYYVYRNFSGQRCDEVSNITNKNYTCSGSTFKKIYDFINCFRYY